MSEEKEITACHFSFYEKENYKFDENGYVTHIKNLVNGEWTEIVGKAVLGHRGLTFAPEE